MATQTKPLPAQQANGENRQVSLIRACAADYQMEPAAFAETVKKTIFPNGTATNEQLAAFLAVAQQYQLNPFTREIFAFPTKGGGIQPVVSIDGWLKIINRHPSYNGMELTELYGPDNRVAAVTCAIFRTDRARPIQVTEYLEECRRDTEPWKKWPTRMLRHKATIQCARYAFNFAGIVDPDEAERIVDANDANVIAAEGTASRTEALKQRLQQARTRALKQGQPEDDPLASVPESHRADKVEADSAEKPPPATHLDFS